MGTNNNAVTAAATSNAVPSKQQHQHKTHQEGKHLLFDYVIVGAGPSAMGLLYGLLSSYYDDNDATTAPAAQDDNSSSSSPRPRISIAVIERGPVGPAFLDQASSRTAKFPLTTNSAPPQQPQPNNVLTSPSTWYNAAHDKHNHHHQNQIHHVQHHRMELAGHRSFELPIGQGIGGTSNINACLSMIPLVEDFESWPDPWKSHLCQEWIPKMQSLVQENGHLNYHHGIASSIPYHYHYYDHNDQNNDKQQHHHPKPTWLHIDKQGTPNLIQVVQEDPRNHPPSSGEPTKKSSLFVRSNYFKAILEPFLAKQRKINETKNNRTSSSSSSSSPRSSSSSSSIAEQSITWFQGVQIERLLVADSSSHETFTSPQGDQRVVVGVEGRSYLHDSQSYTHTSHDQDGNGEEYIQFHARREVILCAGAIESPALLLVDQYEKEQKTSHQQDVGTVLSGVGRNLRDQVILPRAYITPPSVWGVRSQATLSPNGMAFLGHLFISCRVAGGSDSGGSSRAADTDRHIFQVAVTDATGQASTIPPLVSLAFIKRPFDSSGWLTNTETGRATRSTLQRFIQSLKTALYVATKTFLTLVLRYSPLGWFLQHFTTTTLLMIMHPRSSGSVQIRQKRSVLLAAGSEKNIVKDDEPWRRHHFDLDINVGYLQDDRDLQALKCAWDACAELVRPKFFTLFPPKGLDRAWWWKWYCSSVSLPYYHFTGTCAMKIIKTKDKNDKVKENVTSNDDWVVDSDLRVRTYIGLRICDASVFPTTISTPPALTLVAVGFGLGQLLAKNLKFKDV